MSQIIDITYFQKANELNLPLAVVSLVANPTLATPNNTEALTLLCEKVEKSILTGALGLSVYNTLQLALADINNPLYASYKKLVQGEEYGTKKWPGLDNDYSLIAYRIFEQFLFQTNEALTGVGTVHGKPEKATFVSPKYKIANANSNFIKQYQHGFYYNPVIDGIFIDYYGNQEGIEVSLYQYLNDKRADFTALKMDLFRIYETINSFGI